MPEFFDKNKVLYVANSLVANAGAERRSLEQICFLKDRGLSVEICVLRALGPMADKYREQKIRIHFHKVYEAGENQRLHFSFFKFLKFYLFLLKQRHGIIIGIQPPAHYLVRFACFPPLGRKIYAMERGNTFLRKKKYFFWDRFCSLWTTRIICISKLVCDGLIETSGIKPGKVNVIEQGYKKGKNENLPENLNDHLYGNIVFGCVAMFIPSKRQDILIRAFKPINDKYPKTRLVLIGSGNSEHDLRLLVNNLRLDNKIIFTGNVENPHSYYPFFDVFVFPSILEGMGGVYVEAWLHHLAVICADIRPMNDYVIHMKNGILFTPDSVCDLSKWMRFLIDNPTVRKQLGKEGNKTAKTVFDYKKQMNRLYHLITD